MLINYFKKCWEKLLNKITKRKAHESKAKKLFARAFKSTRFDFPYKTEPRQVRSECFLVQRFFLSFFLPSIHKKLHSACICVLSFDFAREEKKKLWIKSDMRKNNEKKLVFITNKRFLILFFFPCDRFRLSVFLSIFV